jgi:hypothetical protein
MEIAAVYTREEVDNERETERRRKQLLRLGIDKKNAFEIVKSSGRASVPLLSAGVRDSYRTLT